MNSFKRQFTSIKDISDRRRLPRLGKIRLGIKKVSQKTGKEYPVEKEYFVCPPEVQKQFGAQPTELPIMFPIEDREIIFPQAYKYYGKSKGLKCIGDGEVGMRVTDSGEFTEIECPCELLDKKECQRRAHLMVIIPKVSVGGVYQIDLGSYHSIVDINSGIDYVRAMIGRFAWVPLILRRVPRETHGGDKKTTHHTLQVEFHGDVNTINLLRENTMKILEGPRYAIPAPIDENPKMDEGGITEYTDEEKPQSVPEPEPETKRTPEQKRKEISECSPRGFNLLKKKMVGKIMSINSDKLAEAVLPKNLTGDQANQLMGIVENIEEPITIENWFEEMRKIGAIE